MTPHVLRRSRRGLAYELRGNGPVVLLVHGWCLDRTVWLYQQQSLIEQGFTVVSPDLAGYGASASLAARPSFEEHGADLVDLLDELGVEGVTAVGFAFGAAALMSLPSYTRLGGVVAIGVPSAAGAPYPKMKAAMLRDWPLFAERSAKAICARDHSEASLRWLGDVYARTPLPSALTGADLLAAFEPLEVVQAWDVPFLFVHGAEDKVVSPTISAKSAAAFAGATPVVVADSGHFVPWDQPAELGRLIAEFARSTK